jgi:hypothetical protein
MDWGATNDNPTSTWEQRPKVTDATWTRYFLLLLVSEGEGRRKKGGEGERRGKKGGEGERRRRKGGEGEGRGKGEGGMEKGGEGRYSF